MKNDNFLICAFKIRPGGTAETLLFPNLSPKLKEGEWIWLHFDITEPGTKAWLHDNSGLDEHAVNALLAEETRPRVSSMGRGNLVILRGVNLHPQSDPTDMISVRLWIEDKRIISTRFRRLLSVTAIRERCDANDAPETVGEFVVDLNNGLIERMSGVLGSLEDKIEAIEQTIDQGSLAGIRQRLVAARQKIIPLRRFISPQRDAVSHLIASKVAWLSAWQRDQLKECADRLTRYVEELDTMRERSSVIQDTVSAAMSEQMNKNMMVLSVVAAIFLPLGLLTGLLGVNVEGIPGAENSPWAFWIVVAILVFITVFQIWLFRRMGLIGRASNKYANE